MKKALWILAWMGVMMAMACCAPAQSESILVISDLHLTDHSADSQPALDAVRHALRGCDALVLLGDNTNNGKWIEHRLLLSWLHEASRASGAEIYVVPGNHDLSPAVNRAQFEAMYLPFGQSRAFSRDIASSSCAVMTRQGTCLLLMDTNACDGPNHAAPAGGISEETLRWTRKVLSGLPDGTPVVACGHHPLLPETRLQPTPNGGRLANLFREYRVPVYLCGHDHGFAAVDALDFLQITVGQPQAYPGWCGVVRRAESGLSWHVQALYGPADPFFTALKQKAESLAWNMGKGTLRGTAYEEDADAIGWFARAFLQYVTGSLSPAECGRLLADDNCRKWREIETRTVVKSWIFSLLEHCPADVKNIEIPRKSTPQP